jgi:XapX domain-containing protein
MAYLVSLLVGIAVGVAYALLGVKSPAPPLVALVGLLGIVIGEQGVPWAKERLAERHAVASSPRTPGQHNDSR